MTRECQAGGASLPRRLCVVALPLLVAALCGWMGSRLPWVAPGGDAPAYLLAARHDPLLDNFDNPSHGWGFPALVKLVTPAVHDEYVAALVVSALAAGLLVFAAAALAFRFAPPLWATLSALVVAGLPAVLIAGSAAMSDALFAALAALAVWCTLGRAPERATPGSAAAAGALTALSLCVRGNGIALLLCLPLALLLVRRGRQVAWFATGVALVLALAALLFLAHGAPLSRMLPSGAPELAFATLDESGTWNARLAYEQGYSSYLSVLSAHGPAVARAAAKTLWHLHDWWLLPTLSVLGFLTLPGLLLWLRRPTRAELSLALVFLGVQATYLWSGRFAQPRHVLAAVPFLALVSVLGLRLLPRRLPGRLSRVRLRTPLAVLVVAVTLAVGARSLLQNPRFDPRSGLVQDLTNAGLWLGERAAPGEGVAASRLNIAWYARLWPLNFTDVFAAGFPDREHLAAHLHEQGCSWLAWIDGHSEKAFGELSWLADGGDFPGAERVHRQGAVTLWRITSGAGARSGH